MCFVRGLAFFCVSIRVLSFVRLFGLMWKLHFNSAFRIFLMCLPHSSIIHNRHKLSSLFQFKCSFVDMCVLHNTGLKGLWLSKRSQKKTNLTHHLFFFVCALISIIFLLHARDSVFAWAPLLCRTSWILGRRSFHYNHQTDTLDPYECAVCTQHTTYFVCSHLGA